MKKQMLLIASILAFGCGQNPEIPKDDPIFHQIKAYFFYRCAKTSDANLCKSRPDISISLVNSMNCEASDAAGCCHERWHKDHLGGTKKYRYITIDKNFWMTSNEDKRLKLIFHEMGHCIIDKEHSYSENIRGLATSIMSSKLNQSNSTQEGYILELFGGSNQAVKDIINLNYRTKIAGINPGLLKNGDLLKYEKDRLIVLRKETEGLISIYEFNFVATELRITTYRDNIKSSQVHEWAQDDVEVNWDLGLIYAPIFGLY